MLSICWFGIFCVRNCTAIPRAEQEFSLAGRAVDELLPKKILKLRAFRRCSSSNLCLLQNAVRRMKNALIDQKLLLLTL